jgi:hypothetical protein
MAVAVVVVTMVVVMTCGPRVGRDGEHRQHGCDGEELGEVHGSFFLLE